MNNRTQSIEHPTARKLADRLGDAYTNLRRRGFEDTMFLHQLRKSINAFMVADIDDVEKGWSDEMEMGYQHLHTGIQTLLRGAVDNAEADSVFNTIAEFERKFDDRVDNVRSGLEQALLQLSFYTHGESSPERMVVEELEDQLQYRIC